MMGAAVEWWWRGIDSVVGIGHVLSSSGVWLSGNCIGAVGCADVTVTVLLLLLLLLLFA